MTLITIVTWLALLLAGAERCESGVVTLHGLMPEVLETFPERECSYCDGYIAVLNTADLGKDFVLTLNGKTYTVRAADVASSAHVRMLKKRRPPWIADVSAELWIEAGIPMGDELAPAPATICPRTVYYPTTLQNSKLEMILNILKIR